MTYDEFRAIIADIESHLERGEGYHIAAYLNSGNVFRGAWEYLRTNPKEIIVLSKHDQPPLYIPISTIELVQLSNR